MQTHAIDPGMERGAATGGCWTPGLPPSPSFPVPVTLSALPEPLCLLLSLLPLLISPLPAAPHLLILAPGHQTAPPG